MCVTECVFGTLYVITLNETSRTLNMTLVIYDIEVSRHGSHVAKCSIS